MSKNDQAAKIAEREYPIDDHSTCESDAFALSMRGPLARRIRRAIAAAVRKERERCIECVAYSKRATQIVHHAGMCDAIIDAIRKGKA